MNRVQHRWGIGDVHVTIAIALEFNALYDHCSSLRLREYKPQNSGGTFCRSQVYMQAYMFLSCTVYLTSPFLSLLFLEFSRPFSTVKQLLGSFYFKAIVAVSTSKSLFSNFNLFLSLAFHLFLPIFHVVNNVIPLTSSINWATFTQAKNKMLLNKRELWTDQVLDPYFHHDYFCSFSNDSFKVDCIFMQAQ